MGWGETGINNEFLNIEKWNIEIIIFVNSWTQRAIFSITETIFGMELVPSIVFSSDKTSAESLLYNWDHPELCDGVSKLSDDELTLEECSNALYILHNDNAHWIYGISAILHK